MKRGVGTMAPIAKQTVKNKNLSFFKILIMIIGTVLIMNFATGFFSQYGPAIGSLSALFVLILCTIVCVLIIYKNLVYYNYRVIEDELMVERVIGRANHVFFNIKLEDIKYIRPYNEFETDNKNAKSYRFVIDRNKDKWYVIEFPRKDKNYILIIEPNEVFLKALNQSLQISK